MSKRSRAADNDEDRAHGDTARADKQHKVGPTVPAHSDFSVGWVCALSTEQTAATAMLDHQYDDLPKPPNDPNCYTLGSIGKHKVVIACLPEGETGTDVAASTVPWMISTFPSIRFALMVGIGGGIPPKVRLGDIVVSTPAGQYPGVVQWDSGKAKDGGKFERTGALNNPPASLRTALAKLKTAHEMYGPRVQEYLDDLGKNYPKLASRYLKSSSLTDVLFKRDYARVTQRPSDFKVTEDDDEDEGEDEPTCRFCDRTKEVTRKPREMRVHYGVIASGNQIIKDSAFRDRLNDDLGGGVLCVEMEAAGLMNNFPCIVIRGICDYADSHKNKYWQPYAAAVAAAFAKELLQYVQATDLNAERPAGDILNEGQR